MKHFFKNYTTLLSSLLCIVVISCSQNRQIVPYEVDLDEIYKALPPNDENPQQLNFGQMNVPGFIFDYDFTTENEDVFINFNNFTVLDVNPLINKDLLNFINEELKDYGFINSEGISEEEISSILSEGLSYEESVATILKKLQAQFEEQLPEILSYKTPFNAYFQIYPLYFGKNLVTYRLTAYCYTGGAHGMTITYIRSYDLRSGKSLSFDDIVTPQGREDVRNEIAAHMAYSYPIYDNITTVEQYIDSLNKWLDFSDSDQNKEEITISTFPTGDVALIKEGLVCVYQMYELTPGSDGCPVVVISYKDLKGCLNPQYLDESPQ